MGKVWVCALLGSALLAPWARVSAGTTFTPGNILVTHESTNTLREYTRAGQLVQSIPVPWPAGQRPSSEYVRDVVAIDAQRAAMFNGTFDPYLSVYDSATNTWTHSTAPGWSTINNRTYGGITRLGASLFVSDMATGSSEDMLNGLLRHREPIGDWTRFGEGYEFRDVTAGLNEQLYAVENWTDWTAVVRVFAADSLTLNRTLYLHGWDVRALAVNASGKIFAGSNTGILYRYGADGVLEQSVSLGVNIADVEFSPTGELLVAGDNTVFLTDESLSSISSFSFTSTYAGIFAAFAIPEPSTAMLLALLLLSRRRPG